MTENWVVNASPLILLGKAGELGWLPRLGDVVVPRSVALEVLAGAPEDSARRWLEAPEGACQIRDHEMAPEIFAWDLGPGETAVLSWAQSHPGYEAVLDDAAARRCARVFGIPVRGTLSLVALAKHRGHVPACRPVFERLLEAGLFVSPELVEQVAASVGE